MKLIIDIPEDLYKEEIRGTASDRQCEKILKCVKKGIPIPKEHGDLIDSNALCEKYDMCLDLYQALDLTPVIIKGE